MMFQIILILLESAKDTSAVHILEYKHFFFTALRNFYFIFLSN